MTARKITLEEARESGVVALICYCGADSVAGPGCRHSGTIALGPLLARFGGAPRIDALRWRCSACGRQEVDVRPDWGATVGGGSKRLADT
jgi:hypothetical protein